MNKNENLGGSLGQHGYEEDPVLASTTPEERVAALKWANKNQVPVDNIGEVVSGFRGTPEYSQLVASGEIPSSSGIRVQKESDRVIDFGERKADKELEAVREKLKIKGVDIEKVLEARNAGELTFEMLMDIFDPVLRKEITEALDKLEGKEQEDVA